MRGLRMAEVVMYRPPNCRVYGSAAPGVRFRIDKCQDMGPKCGHKKTPVFGGGACDRVATGFCSPNGTRTRSFPQPPEKTHG